MSEESRVLVFATRKNLEILVRREVWFLDGTFKVAPHLFTQVFLIVGNIDRKRQEAGDIEVVALPFVYALLSSKQTG
ncbi:hypothetical protein TKK_0014572 [Trichogramma kaykai]